MHRLNLTLRFLPVFIALTLVSCHCGETYNPDDFKKSDLIPVALSTTQWTGVAVDKNERLFSNFPNWSADHTISVIELIDSVNYKPFPNAEWNTWTSADPGDHFIAVQAVFVDKANFLWILDAANPQREGEFTGVVPGGAKLVKVDLSDNSVSQVINFKEPVIKPTSYLNDVRIDEKRNVAYITDSNEGALLIVNLATGTTRRLLGDHPSTKSENIILTIDGQEYRNPQGKYPVIHSDGIALSTDGERLYWKALTSRSMYWALTADLLNETLSDGIGNRVNKIDFIVPPADGMIFGPDGVLYLTSITDHSILGFRNDTYFTVRKNAALRWPDSFSISASGFLYVSTSQINIREPQEPYRIYKIKL